MDTTDTDTNAEAEKTETDKTNTDKTEAEKTDTDKTEADKTNTDKTETEKTDTDKTNTGKTETNKTNTDKTEAEKTDTVKIEVTKTEAGKTDSGKWEEIRPAGKPDKIEQLKRHLSSLGSVAVAFSGGVDSAFLLKTAYEVLGARAAAVTVQSCIFPERELKEAAQFCAQSGIRQIVCSADTLNVEGFAHNPKNRCYLCKKDMMRRILDAAKKEGFAHVAEGSNTDDEGDYRPGRQAVAELGIESPLRDAGLSKKEIREYAKAMGLPVWNKPSFACLASRFVYGEAITQEKLEMTDRAEQQLFALGFTQVRVRVHGTMARIEVLPEQFYKLADGEVRRQIVSSFRSAGFSYVTMDLEGYRTGSMNEMM